MLYLCYQCLNAWFVLDLQIIFLMIFQDLDVSQADSYNIEFIYSSKKMLIIFIASSIFLYLLFSMSLHTVGLHVYYYLCTQIL